MAKLSFGELLKRRVREDAEGAEKEEGRKEGGGSCGGGGNISV